MSSPTTDRRLGLTGNTAYKAPVALATLVNITLSGEQSVDGVTTSTSRVLVKNQTDTTQNGLYDSSSAAWTRCVDGNGNYDLTPGTQVLVHGGSQAYTIWTLTGTAPLVIGTSAIAWAASLHGSLATYAASGGSALIGYLAAGTGAVARTAQAKLRERVSVFDFIPVAYHAAIQAYTSTVDVIDYINAAIDAAYRVDMPYGHYYVSRPVNMSARGEATANWGKRLIGDGIGNTFIYAYTGNYPGIDLTGMVQGEVSNLSLRSDNPGAFGLSAADAASIGIFHGRGAVSTQGAQLRLDRLQIVLTSDMTRNAGVGTVGICNEGSEHVTRSDISIYANLPLVDATQLPFVVSRSADIPTYGADYEEEQSAPNSCTNHQNFNMSLISYDSFRAWWTYQVANADLFGYTSTRYVNDLTPSYSESFYFEGGGSNINARVYQEASGLFGATYRMDHAYVTYGAGPYVNVNVEAQRGALDQGFTIPVSAVASVRLLDTCQLWHCRVNGNYLPGIYDASGDNNGFAAVPISITGTPGSIRDCEFILDNSTSGRPAHAAFSAIGPYCTNVRSVNFLTGQDSRCDGDDVFTPTAIGLSAAGAGTYTALPRAGKYQRGGQWCDIAIDIGWSAHTGTGDLAISGLPFTSDTDMAQTVPLYADALTVDSGDQLVGFIAAGTSAINVCRIPVAGGAIDGVPMDTAVPRLTATFRYRISDAL
jgi:hypothetical protein